MYFTIIKRGLYNHNQQSIRLDCKNYSIYDIQNGFDVLCGVRHIAVCI